MNGTQRQCSQCKNPAVTWNYTFDIFGEIDKSSRTPTCHEHSFTNKSTDPEILDAMNNHGQVA